MNKIGIVALAAMTSLPAAATFTTSKPEDVARRIPQESEQAKRERMAWWTHDRFGMFIHFGLYAMPARHEWIKKLETIPEAHYDEYFRRFDPDLFDAKAWARAAKDAGMKYAVLTTKHHEGFCLWDSKVTDYKITKTPFGRDLVREFVDAFRGEGLRVGFYYSLIDWHHPDFTVDCNHPRRPKSAENYGTRGDGEGTYEEINAHRDMAKYRRYMLDQIGELLTDYGRIDIAWFDFSYAKDEYGKGRDDWDSAAILSLARRLQPGIIVDNRLDLDDVPGGIDFVTPEQYKVTEWPMRDGKRVPWETCQTFSGSWGYHRDEATWKSQSQLIELLVHTVAHGGNLILNVGPTARGEFDARASDRLAGFARWMHFNSRSIYGCTAAPDGVRPPDGTLLTYNPERRRLYLHLPNYPMGRVGISFADKIAYAQFLHDASEIPVLDSPGELAKESNTNSGFNGFLGLPVVKPRVEVPVVEMFMKEDPGK